MISATTSNKHTTLSERLQLLYELCYSDADMPYQAVDGRSNEDVHTNTDIQMLHLIAICMTTGKAADVVATALDKRQNLCLVLAKNGHPSLGDLNMTREFFVNLQATNAKYWLDLFPFLVSRSRENISRVRNLHDAIAIFMPDVVGSVINQYHLSLLTKSFPSRLFIASKPTEIRSRPSTT